MNPANVTDIKKDKISNELDRLYEQTGLADAYPKVAEKTITYNGKKFQLTPKQYTEYQRKLGQQTHEMYRQLIENDAKASEIIGVEKGSIKLYYSEMDDKQRRQAEKEIRKTYEADNDRETVLNDFQADNTAYSVDVSYTMPYSQLGEKVRVKVLKEAIAQVNDSVKEEMREDVIANGRPKFSK